MPDRYIKPKGIIFDKIAEKGDTDQMTKPQKENRQLMEKPSKPLNSQCRKKVIIFRE